MWALKRTPRRSCGVAAPEVQGEDRHQDEDGAEQRVEQELDRRVLPVLAAPDGDQEVHRQEHDLEEDVEEDQVERQEHAHHAGQEQQEQGVIAADFLLDVPRRQARQDRDEAGEHDEAEADAVEPEIILDVERGDPRLANHQVVSPVGPLGLLFAAFGEQGRVQPLEHIVPRPLRQRRLGRRAGLGVAVIGDDRQQERRERDADREPFDPRPSPPGHQERDDRADERDQPEQGQQRVVAHGLVSSVFALCPVPSALTGKAQRQTRREG